MSVLQNWLEEIPLRMQSTLLLSLRGPDTHACPNIKAIQRWMRGLTFKPGNPDNVAEFMGERPVAGIREKSPLAKELEFCTQHFYSHLMHGLEVIAYYHPVGVDQETARRLYLSMCFLMHLVPEDQIAFEQRLCERLWPGGKQPNDFEEAMEVLREHGNNDRESHNQTS
jgi:hypothetical protein